VMANQSCYFRLQFLINNVENICAAEYLFRNSDTFNLLTLQMSRLSLLIFTI